MYKKLIHVHVRIWVVVYPMHKCVYAYKECACVHEVPVYVQEYTAFFDSYVGSCYTGFSEIVFAKESRNL